MIAFLLDENLPPSLVPMLRGLGLEARHVVEIGLNRTPDFRIAAFAAESGETILTHDTDFGTILAMSGESRPSVVLFRWQKISVASLFEFFETHLNEIETPLAEGAFIVVDEYKMRVRKLPLLIVRR